MRPLATFALTASLLVAPAFARAATAPSATTQLKQQNDRIDKLLKQKRAGADGAAKEEMRSIVNGLLDYEELSKRALANHWGEITAAQQAEFVKTLRELIEKNYLKQLQTNLDYEVIYKGETGTADDASVSTLVKIRTKGKSTDTPIDYKMKKVGERWLVYDVITDDVSMVKNYRQQFNKIISNEGFDALLKKMRTKIKEADEPEGGAKSADAGDAAKPAPPGDKPGGKPVANGGKPVANGGKKR